MAGRIPKTPALKKLQGHPGKRKLNNSGPRLDGTTPECPVWLDAEAKREWDRVVHALHESGILTNVDRAVLAAYCQSYARWVEAETQVEKEGQVLERQSGRHYLNPNLAAASLALKQLMAYAVQLGLTPAARSRIGVEKPAQEPTLADILLSGR